MEEEGERKKKQQNSIRKDRSGLPDILILYIREQHLMAINEAQIKPGCLVFT